MKPVLLLLAILAVPVYAADSPQFKVNDTWKLGETDLWRKERVNGLRYTVIEVSDKEIVVEVREEKGRRYKRYYTPEGNPTASSSREYIPHMPLYSFPLVVGKTWKKDYQIKRNEGVATYVSMEVKVAAFEKVEVPAGAFDSYKLTYHASYRKPGEKGIGTMESTYWYAPSIGRMVKEEYRDTGLSGRLNDQFVRQLESYELAK